MTPGSKFASVAFAAVLMTTACSGDDSAQDAGTTAATSSTGATPTTTGASPSTTLPPETVTTAPPETTTTTAAKPSVPVTEHEALPPALPPTEVPWDRVAEGWLLALYSADRVTGTLEDGPRVLYLVSPEGDRYEVASWAADAANRPWEVLALSNDGRSGLLTRPMLMDPDAIEVIRIDLETGAERLVFGGPPLATIRAGLSLPTGEHVALAMDTGNRDRLQILTPDGEAAEIVETASARRAPISWLYGLDGTFLVVGDINGMRLIGTDGTVVRELASPGRCIPVRWWDVTTVLAACIPPRAPDDSTYRKLSTIPLSGEDATTVTALPDSFEVVGDFGYQNAWTLGGTTVLQWAGDCNALELRELRGRNGRPITLETEFAPRVVTATDEVLIVHGILGCGDAYGPLLAVRADGTTGRILVPRVSEEHSAVISAAGMTLVP